MVKLRVRVGVYASLVAGLAALGGCPGGTSSSPPAPPASTPPATGTPAPATPSTPAPPTGAAAAGGFGSIKGRVIAVKPPAPPAVIDVAKDDAVCGKTHDPGSLKLGAGGAVETCVVYLKGPAAPADWDKTGPYEIDQKGCHYEPRVLIVPVGGTVAFKSSDPVLHNVKTTYKSFNVGVSKGSSQTLKCDTPEWAELSCSIHPFMQGLLVVAENPWYRLTDATGSFKLDKVPAGTWKIFARHEVLKKHSKEGTTVTVEADKEAVVDLEFKD